MFKIWTRPTELKGLARNPIESAPTDASSLHQLALKADNNTDRERLVEKVLNIAHGQQDVMLLSDLMDRVPVPPSLMDRLLDRVIEIADRENAPLPLVSLAWSRNLNYLQNKLLAQGNGRFAPRFTPGQEEKLIDAMIALSDKIGDREMLIMLYPGKADISTNVTEGQLVKITERLRGRIPELDLFIYGVE